MFALARFSPTALLLVAACGSSESTYVQCPSLPEALDAAGVEQGVAVLATSSSDVQPARRDCRMADKDFVLATLPAPMSPSGNVASEVYAATEFELARTGARGFTRELPFGDYAVFEVMISPASANEGFVTVHGGGISFSLSSDNPRAGLAWHALGSSSFGSQGMSFCATQRTDSEDCPHVDDPEPWSE